MFLIEGEVKIGVPWRGKHSIFVRPNERRYRGARKDLLVLFLNNQSLTSAKSRSLKSMSKLLDVLCPSVRKVAS